MSSSFDLKEYWSSYAICQKISFFRFLLYGWYFGIVGIIIFYPLYFFALPYYIFYTMSFKDGRNTASKWLTVNTRRCFGATISEANFQSLNNLYNKDD